MLKFFIFILILSIFLVIGSLVSENQGYIHVEYLGYVVEMSVVALFLITALFAFLCTIVYLILSRFYIFNKYLFNWFKSSSKKEYSKNLKKSVTSLIEEDFQSSMNYSLKCLKNQKDDFFAKMAYFQAGLKLSDQKAVNQALDLLANDGTNEKIIKILKIKKYIYFEDFQSAFNIISTMQNELDKVLYSKLYYKILKGLKKYDLIAQNVQNFYKLGIVNQDEFYDITAAWFKKEISNLNSIKELDKKFKELPKESLGFYKIILAYADMLYKFGNKKKSLKLIDDLLTSNTNNSLVYLELLNWRSADEDMVKFLEAKRLDLIKSGELDIDLDLALAQMYYTMGNIGESKLIYDEVLKKCSSQDVFSKYGQLMFYSSH